MTDNDDSGTDGDEWNPQPAQLREGERRDVSAHAQGNLEQIRQFERDGILTEQEADEAAERIRQRDQEVDDGDE